MKSPLTKLVKPQRTQIEVGGVLSLTTGMAQIETLRGIVWAHCDLAVVVGDHVAFSRDGSQVLVLQKVRRPSVETKTVRI